MVCKFFNTVNTDLACMLKKELGSENVSLMKCLLAQKEQLQCMRYVLCSLILFRFSVTLLVAVRCECFLAYARCAT